MESLVPPALVKVRTSDDDLRRRGSVLAVLLVVMIGALCILWLYNLLVSGGRSYTLVNAVVLALLAGLFVLNRLGWIRFASLLTVALTTIGALSLIDADFGASYMAITIPILISSYLLAPWAGIVAAAVLGIGAGILGAGILGASPLALVVFGMIAIIFYIFTDNLHRAYQHSRHQALHDQLTGLPNRDFFHQHLRAAQEHAHSSDHQIAVLFLDLDNFKLINDSLGHDYGDRLLREVTERLKRCLRKGDIVARFGGDEFILLLKEIDELADAVSVAERVAEEFKTPFDLYGQEVAITSCVGIAIGGHLNSSLPASSPGTAVEGPGNLLRDADIALYQAKLRKDSYEVFSQDMHWQALDRLELERELHAAIEENEFEVYFQPKFSLDNHRLVSVEALLRWGSKERGMVMPSEIVPVAEETGLIVPIGEAVLEKACSQASVWYTAYECFKDVTLSVNLSARQFSDPDLTSTVSQVLERYSLPTSSVQLEITESMLLDDQALAIKRLSTLKASGLKISLDDFGKAYSSLRYLKELPIDTLKVDQLFVAGLTQYNADTAIVRLVIELAHELGIEVVAEGVETEDQLSQLTALGCDVVQGFYFSKPLPAHELEDLLRQENELR